LEYIGSAAIRCGKGQEGKKIGGSAWESNPPGTPLSAPHWI